MLPDHLKLDLNRRCGDVAVVKIPTLRRILLALGVGVALLVSPAASFAATPAPVADVVPMGDNTFSITRRATNAFSRDTDKLKQLAEADASSYCAAHGKQLKIVSLTSDKPFFSTGYASAKIVFKALNPGEVEKVAVAATDSSAAPYVERPMTTDEMYSGLMKLDELRKKGILTDDEFQAEKRKILNRSK